MPTQSTQIFLGSTPIPIYYLGDTQMGINPASVTTIPTAGLVYLFDATNVASYPTSGSIWYDLSPNKTWASTFSSSVFPSYDVVSKEFNFNGTSQGLVAPITASIGTGSVITDFTQIMWVKLPGTQTDVENGIVNLQTGSVALAGAPVFDAISFNHTTDVWRLTSNFGERNITSTTTETAFNEYLMITSTRTSGTNGFTIRRNGSTVIAQGTYTPNRYKAGPLALLSTIGNRFYNSDTNTWPSDGWISGSISSVILYNRVLSNDEINQIYNVGRTGIVI